MYFTTMEQSTDNNNNNDNTKNCKSTVKFVYNNERSSSHSNNDNNNESEIEERKTISVSNCNNIPIQDDRTDEQHPAPDRNETTTVSRATEGSDAVATIVNNNNDDDDDDNNNNRTDQKHIPVPDERNETITTTKRATTTATTVSTATSASASSAMFNNIPIASSTDFYNGTLLCAGAASIASGYNATSLPGTMKDELNRLNYLHAFSALSGSDSEQLNRLSKMAAKMFNTKYSVILLVDLRRTWLLASTGFDKNIIHEQNFHEKIGTFFNFAFHVTDTFLLVPDVKDDTRFPAVTVQHNDNSNNTNNDDNNKTLLDIRFACCAPLTSPEGSKIGLFCVFDDQPRHSNNNDNNSNTDNDNNNNTSNHYKENLIDYATTAVDMMRDQRYRIDMQEKQAQTLAYTAHDLMTPLTGLQLSVSLLTKDNDLSTKLNEHQQEILTTISRCSDVMASICKESLDRLRGAEGGGNHNNNNNKTTTTTTSAVSGVSGVPYNNNNSNDNKKESYVKLHDFVESLYQVMFPIPKQVPMFIEIDKSAPDTLLCDDIKIFQVALSLLSIACARTTAGSVRLRIFMESDNGKLRFECEDSGPVLSDNDRSNILKSKEPNDFTDSSLTAYHLPASLLLSVPGSACGFWSRQDTPGSVFWFTFINQESKVGCSEDLTTASMPVVTTTTAAAGATTKRPDSNNVVENGILYKNGKRKHNDGNSNVTLSPKRIKTLKQAAKLSAPDNENTSGPRQKKVLVVDDSLILRKSIGRTLTKMGYEVKLAENGLEGLNMLKADLFDFCLCDFLMPVMDGMDMVRQLREWEKDSRPDFHQLVVGISAHAAGKDSQKGINAGMDDFFPKPITIDILEKLQHYDSVLESSRKLDELAAAAAESSSSSSVASCGSTSQQDAATTAEQHHGSASSTKVEMHHHPNSISTTMTTAKKSKPGKKQEAAAKTTTTTGHQEVSIDSSSGSPQIVDAEAGSSAQKNCLIVSSDSSGSLDSTRSTTSDFVKSSGNDGWSFTRATNSDEATHQLKIRNWEAVLVDENLLPLSSAETVACFRAWENNNRFNRQNNIFLVHSSPSEQRSWVQWKSAADRSYLAQAPFGFDGLISKPIIWEDFCKLIDSRPHSSLMRIITH